MDKLTPHERDTLARHLDRLAAAVRAASTDDHLAKVDFKTILADLLKQMGPYLLEILISLLTAEQTK